MIGGRDDRRRRWPAALNGTGWNPARPRPGPLTTRHPRIIVEPTTLDRRANAAKNHLAARGVALHRMTVISYGKERPEALGSDESAWAQNRRAVTVLPQ